jgi:formylglycine-generating enzyme required for sulfatase activity
MREIARGMTVVLAMLASTTSAGGPPSGPLQKCPVDAVVSGTVCMDKYEATVWRVQVPTTVNKGLVSKIREGKATQANLLAGAAVQLGVFSDDYTPCDDSGQNCDDIFAVSLPNELPSSGLTWFQMQAACKNSRKRLPSNAEWQAAVMGTPDPGPDNGMTDCNTNSFGIVRTGSRSSCVSADGAFDMVGNLDESVADWVPRSTGCGAWGASVSPTGDTQCMAGAATTGEPAPLKRGGFWIYGTKAGPLWIYAQDGLSDTGGIIGREGFRCAR